MHSFSVAFLRCGLAPVLTLALSPAPHAQQSPGNAPAGEGDPAALAAHASKLNNLAVSDVQPWHIKASFQLFDEQGNVTSDGTWEDFWSGPQKFKSIVKGKDFSETRYGGDQGDLRADVTGDVPSVLSSAQHDLLNPFPETPSGQKTDVTAKEVEMGALKLTCLTYTSVMSITTHCVGRDEPLLRVSSYPASSLKVSRNRMLRFSDRVIPGDLKILLNGKTALTLHVDSIETLADPNDDLFTAPAGAVKSPVVFKVAQDITLGMLEYKVSPEYPPAAKNSRTQGVVVLQAIIGKDGRLKNIQVISGAKIFQGSAIQAVQQWRYRPYLLYGQPVEIMTTINVAFTLGNSPQ